MKAQSTGTTSPFSPAGIGYKPVITPNGLTLPWKMINGVKVFHLIAEPVTHEFASGLVAECWGYNGRVHGPTIEAVEGDHVRIYVTNRLSAPTSVHWHAILLPSGMDGVAGVSQKPIQPGETFKYEYTLKQHGTFMYHSHHDEMTQMQLGMIGLFVIHPKNARKEPPDRDYAIMLSEWKIEVGARRPAAGPRFAPVIPYLQDHQRDRPIRQQHWKRKDRPLGFGNDTQVPLQIPTDKLIRVRFATRQATNQRSEWASRGQPYRSAGHWR
jgi:FtsP/CotA-like multicopper oxidase with cupredoxin domain